LRQLLAETASRLYFGAISLQQFENHMATLILVPVARLQIMVVNVALNNFKKLIVAGDKVQSFCYSIVGSYQLYTRLTSVIFCSIIRYKKLCYCRETAWRVTTVEIRPFFDWVIESSGLI